MESELTRLIKTLAQTSAVYRYDGALTDLADELVRLGVHVTVVE